MLSGLSGNRAWGTRTLMIQLGLWEILLEGPSGPQYWRICFNLWRNPPKWLGTLEYSLGCAPDSQWKMSTQRPGGCFTNISRVLQNNLAKIYSARNHNYDENFKLKLCTCAQSMALGTCPKFQLEILMRIQLLQYTNFERIFWRAGETLVKQPPGYHDGAYGKSISI